MASLPLDDRAAFTVQPVAKRFDIPCTITVEQSSDHFHAHGLHEALPFLLLDLLYHVLDLQLLRHSATKVRFDIEIARRLTRLAAYFDLTELYEVSFNPGRVLK